MQMMTRTYLHKYINKQTGMPITLIRAWLPIVLDAGRAAGYDTPKITRFIVILGRMWANHPFAMQSLTRWFKGQNDPATRLVTQELARHAYHHNGE